MKTKNCVAFLFIVMVTVSSFGQTPDTVTIPNDGLMGTINAIIQGDTTSSGEPTHPERVYRLVRGGYYMLKGPITIKAGTRVTILGDTASSSVSDPGPAVIIEGAVPGETYPFNFDCFGDLTMKHVRLMYVTNLGTQYWTCIGFGADSLSGIFDDVIFEWSQGLCIYATGKNFKGVFNSCVFRNDIDPSQWWAGRQIGFNANGSIDSISCENCTFENMGMVMATIFGPPQYMWLNHNTFLNIAKEITDHTYFTNLVCINNIFVNCNFAGERFADRGNDPYPIPWGSTIRIDTLPTGVVFNGVAEQDRKCIFRNNCNFRDTEFQRFYDAYNGTVTNWRDTITGEPMMSNCTLNMFNWHPRFKISGVYDGADPHFVSPATNMDSILAFLHSRYYTGGNVFWGYKSGSPAAPEWPLPENLSYTNTALLSAGMGGFPLGDLYHWFPDEYRAWKDYIKTDGGEIGAVARKSPPASDGFFLGQNYPNPFNPITTIIYELKISGLVTLKVYDVLGREARTLMNEWQVAGSHSVTFDGSKLPSGVYFYRLSTGNYTSTKKAILMK